ncbi:hypothetical protein BGW39_001510 [Mortierella sp. 14UC]|nr:hypothetical protein BGW39_001510 [Mortierella sp. 14UC]
MTLTTSTYSNSVAHSTISSTSSTGSSFKMTVKPCVAKGHRECVQGFLRDRCCKCTKGSVACGMCPSSSSSSSSCIFCVDGRKECDDCYGTGFIQRICRDCIKEHYRRQSNPKPFSLTKVTEQSKSVVFNLSESFLQATKGLVKGVQQQSIQKHHRSGSSVSLPESIASTASSEHSTASAPSSPTRAGSSSKSGFLKRLSLSHECPSSPATASSSSSPSSPNKHRRKWSWSSILTAA